MLKSLEQRMEIQIFMKTQQTNCNVEVKRLSCFPKSISNSLKFLTKKNQAKFY